jgi:amidase
MLVINLRGLLGGDEPHSIQIKNEEAWKKTRNQKLADDRRKIRAEWILESTTIEDARGRVSIAGKYIETLLDAETARLTSLDVPSMMNLTMSGRLSAEDLVTAFCKRAAFAHQLVRPARPPVLRC